MLEIANVGKTFSLDGNRLHDKKALQGFSLTIRDRDFITVIGSNGSGKSTLLNILSGSLAPDQGRIILDGADVTKLSDVRRAKWIGRVFQDPLQGTIAEMSIFENLSIASRRGERQSLAWALSKKAERRFRDLLAPLGLGLEDRLEAKVGTLSGGQRQSLTLLMATMNEPKLLLLDEHTAALDPKTAKTVMEFTNDVIVSDGIPTLMITHNMKDAIKYGNRLIMMADGRTIFSAEGAEKQNLTVEKLLTLFNQSSDEVLPDSMILS